MSGAPAESVTKYAVADNVRVKGTNGKMWTVVLGKGNRRKWVVVEDSDSGGYDKKDTGYDKKDMKNQQDDTKTYIPRKIKSHMFTDMIHKTEDGSWVDSENDTIMMSEKLFLK